jgi:hypothetical protein
MIKQFFCIFAAGALTLSSALSVKNMTQPGVDAQSIADRFIGTGITITSDITLTSTATSAGFYDSASVESQGDTNLLNGIVLSTGHIDSLNSNKNLYDDVTGYLYTPGDSDLTALLPPLDPDGQVTVTHDATVLSFDFTATEDGVASFSYIFGSDEYDEWVNQFNDVFAFFLDGENVAIIPGTDTVPVSINNVNKTINGDLYNDNDLDSFPGGDVPFATEMDGFTKPLTVQFDVNAGDTYNLKLAIADEGDRKLDSWVLLGANSFTLTPSDTSPSDTTCPPDTCPPEDTCHCKHKHHSKHMCTSHHKHHSKHICSSKCKHQSKHICSSKCKQHSKNICPSKNKHPSEHTCTSEYKNPFEHMPPLECKSKSKDSYSLKPIIVPVAGSCCKKR